MPTTRGRSHSRSGNAWLRPLHDARDPPSHTIRVRLDLALPHADHRPAVTPEISCHLGITLDAAGELRFPVWPVRRPEVTPIGVGSSLPNGSGMPEIPIDENGDPGTGKHDVGATRQRGDVLAESKAQPVKAAAEVGFGLISRGADGGHVPPDFIGGFGPPETRRRTIPTHTARSSGRSAMSRIRFPSIMMARAS